MTGQPQLRVHQQPVAAVDAAALEPDAWQRQLLQERPCIEGLTGRRQPECEQVPADHLRARRERKAQPVLDQTAAVGDGLLRQPLQPRAVGQRGLHLLHRERAGAAVEAGCSGRGDQRMAAGGQRRVEF